MGYPKSLMERLSDVLNELMEDQRPGREKADEICRSMRDCDSDGNLEEFIFWFADEEAGRAH